MKKIKILVFLFMLLFFFICKEQAQRVKFNLYANYSRESRSLNKHSLWNPDLVFEPGPIETLSSLSLNPGTRLKWGRTRWMFSPMLTLNEHNEVKIKLREYYAVLELRDFEITAGKVIIKLGTGYMFTPISVVTPERNISDPEDSLRANQGVELVKLDYYRENVNLSAMVFKKNNRANAALLVYCHLAGIDWYGIVYYPGYKKIQWGVAFSTTIGNHVEIHGEWMLHKQSPVNVHRVYFEPNPRVRYLTAPLYNPGAGNYNQYIIGANIAFKKINIIAEYYHKDWGLKPEWFDRLKAYYNFNFEIAPNPLQSPDVLSGLSVIQQGTRGLMRNYLFLRAAWPFQKNIDLSGILFMNLYDTGSVVVFSLDHRLTEGIYLYLKPVFFIGKKGSEFSESWYRHSLQLGIRGVF